MTVNKRILVAIAACSIGYGACATAEPLPSEPVKKQMGRFPVQNSSGRFGARSDLNRPAKKSAEAPSRKVAPSPSVRFFGPPRADQPQVLPKPAATHPKKAKPAAGPMSTTSESAASKSTATATYIDKLRKVSGKLMRLSWFKEAGEVPAPQPSSSVKRVRRLPKASAHPTAAKPSAHADVHPSAGHVPHPAPVEQPHRSDWGFGHFFNWGRIECGCEKHDDVPWYDRIENMRRAHKPCYYFERPFGAALRGTVNAHVARGTANLLTLYHYDFAEGANAHRLAPWGRARLRGMAPVMLHFGFPVVIQSMPGDTELNGARGEAVSELLKEFDPAFAEGAWVVVRPPWAVPLRGDEALIIDANNLRSTAARGQLTTGAAIGQGSQSSAALPVNPSAGP